MNKKATEKLKIVETQEIIKLIDNLEAKEQQKVINYLLTKEQAISLTALKTNNVFITNNSFTLSPAFRLKNLTEEISKALEDASPETIGEIMDAIALYVSKNKC
jgi:hypothetical protein